MVTARTATALVGLSVSLLASAAVWYVFDTAVLFLLVPFVPLLLRRRDDGAADAPDVLACPECGFETSMSGYEYCPRDGTRLVPRGGA